MTRIAGNEGGKVTAMEESEEVVGLGGGGEGGGG